MRNVFDLFFAEPMTIDHNIEGKALGIGPASDRFKE
jgi:hypothetical protein